LVDESLKRPPQGDEKMINERRLVEESYQLESHRTEVFLTEQQLAARHQRSVKTLRNDRVSGGYIPFLKIGRSVRSRLSDVIRYEEANLLTSTSGQNSFRR
jgi:hypothetical protein